MTGSARTPVYAPISLGELVDKVSILEIKLVRIQDEAKKTHILAEHRLLHELLLHQGVRPDSASYASLRAVNEALWELENRIRTKERQQAFDDEFIEIARGIYRLNDQRHELKHAIDLELASSLIGEKEYSDSR